MRGCPATDRRTDVNTEQQERSTPTAKEEDNAMLLQGEIADALCSETGLKPEISNDWARRIVDYLRQRLGAQEIYIPRPSKATRDAAIFREFDGTNAASVMRRHGIRSRSRLYQIVEEQRARQAEQRRQGSDSPVSPLKTGQAGA